MAKSWTCKHPKFSVSIIHVCRGSFAIARTAQEILLVCVCKWKALWQCDLCVCFLFNRLVLLLFSNYFVNRDFCTQWILPMTRVLIRVQGTGRRGGSSGNGRPGKRGNPSNCFTYYVIRSLYYLRVLTLLYM